MTGPWASAVVAAGQVVGTPPAAEGGESVVLRVVLLVGSALVAAVGPLLLHRVRPRTFNLYGALAGALAGGGVAVVWGLVRMAAATPPAFDPARADRLWILVILVGAGLLLLGRTVWTFEVGHSGAVLAGTVVTLVAWRVVRRWHLVWLPEAAPAVVVAVVVAWLVSRALPAPDPE